MKIFPLSEKCTKIAYNKKQKTSNVLDKINSDSVTLWSKLIFEKLIVLQALKTSCIL